MTTEREMSVAAAETAWLDALIGTDQTALRALIAPDAVIVHGPLGAIHGRDDFLAGAVRVGVISEVSTIDVTTQMLGPIAIVSCLQESHIALVPDRTPFVIQAAVSRTWMPFNSNDSRIGWQLVHMQMARRFPPA